MAEKKKEEKKEAPKKAAAKKEEPVPVPLNASAEATPGHFVNVVKGEHKGIYGVIEEVFDYDDAGRPKTVVVVSRDADSAHYSVDYGDLEPAEAGQR